MKYAKIQNNENRRLCACKFGGGIDNSESADEKANSLYYSENLWHKDGVLTSRPSLRAVTNAGFPLNNTNLMGLKITDTVYFSDGKRYNIAYYSTGDGISFEDIHILLVGDKDDIKTLGYIRTSRLDSQTFYKPESIFFIVGERIKGLGVYAFLTCANLGGHTYRIAEAIDSTSEWTDMSDVDKYIPTILLNGKGNKADEAAEISGIDTGVTTSPEQMNIINPKFRACYTSDSLSWSFSLPEKNLDRAIVNCRVYLTETIYVDFTIPTMGGNTQNLGGTSVTAYCVRAEGLIYFTANDAYFPLPRSSDYSTNNVIITATRTYQNGMEKIVGCKNSFICNSSAYIFGNPLTPNEIYSCHLAQPLYFPKNSKTNVGASNQMIVAAGYQNDKVIVFKDGETYKVSVKTGSTIQKESGGVVRNEEFSLSDTLTSDIISTKVGCLSAETLVSFSGQLIWLGKDKKVYTLEATTYGSEKNIFCISEKINNILSSKITADSKPFAMVIDGCYCLFVGSDAFVCSCRVTNMGYAKRYAAENRESISWYFWKMADTNIIGGKNCRDIIFTSLNTVNNIQFFSSFSADEKDSYAISLEDGNFVTSEEKIPVKIESKNYFYECEKKVKPVKISMSVKRKHPVNIAIITNKDVYKKHIHNSESRAEVTADIFAKPSDSIKFTVLGTAPLTFEKAIIEYKTVE